MTPTDILVFWSRETHWINEYKKNGWDVVNVNSPTYDLEKRIATYKRYYKNNIAKKRAYYEANKKLILEKASAKYVSKKKTKILDIVKEV